MTTMSFWLSAAAPGFWTLPTTRMISQATMTVRGQYGSPYGDPSSPIIDDSTQPSLIVPNESGVWQIVDMWFGGSHLHNGAGLISIESQAFANPYVPGSGPATWQVITQNGAWNLIKNIAISNVTVDTLEINNFVDVDVDTGDLAAHSITIEDAKRGTVVGVGDTTLAVQFASNEYGWSNTFHASLGDGQNVVSFEPALSQALVNLTTLEPTTFNAAPQDTHLDLTVGNGDNIIGTQESSDQIHLGNGHDILNLIDGHNEVWLGDGVDNILLQANSRGINGIAIETDVGSDLLHLSSGQAMISLYTYQAAVTPQTTITIPEVLNETNAQLLTIIQDGYSVYPSTQLIGSDWSRLTLATGRQPNMLHRTPGQAGLRRS